MEIEKLLRKFGKNITQERIDIYAGLQDIHLFRAHDVSAKFPNIGRASIFRTLNLFVEIGALRKLSLENRGDFYELNTHNHHEHFECNKCHMIFEFHAGFICKTLYFLAKKQGFLLYNHQILLSGTCSHCNQK